MDSGQVRDTKCGMKNCDTTPSSRLSSSKAFIPNLLIKLAMNWSGIGEGDGLRCIRMGHMECIKEVFAVLDIAYWFPGGFTDIIS